MDSLPLPDGRSTVSGAERVLLSFRGQRDRDLLRSWLEDEFEVLEGSPETVDAFDLCLVDEESYDAFESTLAARREAAVPAFLPVLVMATEPRAVPDRADDVVVMPTRTELLGSRVRSLLRTRRLTRELALFRRAMDATTVGVSITLSADDQPLVYVNEAFERLTGYHRAEVLGRNCRFLQGPDTDPDAVVELHAAVHEGRSTTVVLRNYRADGTPFWNEVSLTPVREGGELTHVLGFQTDVTERVERELELEQERSRFRSLAETAQDAIVSIDADSIIRYANPAVESIFGHTPSALEGEPLGVLMPERLRSDHLAGLTAYLESGERHLDWQHVILKGRHADGHEIPLHISFAEYEDRNGVRFTGIIRDVTEQANLEADLRGERDLMEGVLDSSPIGIVLVNMDGGVERANEQAIELLGLEPSTAPDRRFEEPELIPTDENGAPIPHEDRPFELAMAGERVTDFCHTVEVDGERRWLSVNAVPYRDDGEIVGAVGNVKDITDRVARERDLEQHEAVVKSMREAAWILDTDGRFTFVNPNVTQGAVDDPAALLGEPLSSLAEFFPEDGTLERYARYVDEILAGELEEARLVIEPLVAGPPLTIELTLAPMVRDGTIEGVVGLSRDVTERIEYERELEQYEAVVQSMREAAWVLDDTGRLVYVSPQAAAAMGTDPADLVGEPLSSFAPLFGEAGSLEQYVGYVDELLDGTRSEATMLFAPALSGPQVVFEVSLTPLYHDGTVEGVVGLARDVSDRVERDRRISVLDRVLRHNLRNKLNVVLGNVRELHGSDDVTGDAANGSLTSAIEVAAEELLELSEAARRFESAIRPGERGVTSTDVVPRVRHVAVEAGLIHGVEIATDLPARATAAAHESFELALEELVENAIVHADSDASVTISVVDRPEADVVEIRVVDDGPGLPEMERAVLQRGEETPLEHMQGLGLWFVNWTVSASGGTVEVTDNDPRGTVVTIRLPRA